jgi:biotin transport system substrate-specific component
MTTHTVAQPTMISVIWPAAQSNRAVRVTTLAVLGSLILWASAKIHIPFWPVPMTMQTFAVLVLGAAYGWRLGSATVILYLAEGAMGLPVFSGTPERGIGIAYMAGPTGGYLIGFVAAVAFVGWLAERGWDHSLWRMLVAMTIGHALVFLFGLAWLTGLIGLEQAVAVGLTPFWTATVLKTALAAAVLPLAWRTLTRTGE